MNSSLVVSNGSNESTSSSSQECNVGESDCIHQFITTGESDEEEGSNCSNDDHSQTNVESGEIGDWKGNIQVVGTVSGVEIDDGPSKDTSTESIDDARNGTLCTPLQEEDKDGSEGDS